MVDGAAAGDDFVTDEEPPVVVVKGGSVGVEFTGCDAVLSGVVVEPADGVVGGGHHRHRFAPQWCLRPGVDDLGFHLVGGASVEPSVPFVFGDDADVACSEASGGVGFPVVGEAVDVVEFDGTVGVREVAEHAAPSDG
jgi:hypothetical protein